jgi:glycosyltransferase involved in cell wall biosynthesis
MKRFLLRAADATAAAVFVGLGAVALVPLGLGSRLTGPWRRRGAPRRILYLGTGQIAQVFPRNGVNLFLERECSDFAGTFEQLWNVHFPAGARGSLDLTPRHHLVDFDLGLPAMQRSVRLAPVALREVAFLLWVIPFAWRRRIAVVTATNPYLQGVNALLVSAALGVPYGVIVTRDYEWDWRVLGRQAFPSLFPSRALEERVQRWVLAGAKLVLADRRYYAAFARRNGARPRATVVTRVLADRTYDEAVPNDAVRARFGLGPGPLLVYVGRLDAEKMAMDLVECLALVRQQFPAAQLVCAGRGALEQPMRERARALGIEDGLWLLGNVPLEQLPSLVAGSDLVVAAHMGYTLPEAGFTGTPIATYDYDWHGELIEDGVTGYLAPFGDVSALAARVCAALADPAEAAARGARLQARLRREHTLEAVVPMYRAAYEAVLDGRLPGSDLADGAAVAGAARPEQPVPAQ